MLGRYGTVRSGRTEGAFCPSEAVQNKLNFFKKIFKKRLTYFKGFDII